MKMQNYKIAVIALITLLSAQVSLAQQYMRFSWKDLNMDYSAFAYLIDSEHVIVRINSTQNGVLKLAEATGKLRVHPGYSPKARVLEIGIGEVIYSKDNKMSGSFPAFRLFQENYDPVTNKVSGRSYVAQATKIAQKGYISGHPDTKVQIYTKLSDVQQNINAGAYFLKEEAYYKQFAKTNSNTSANSNSGNKPAASQSASLVTVHLILLGDTKDASIGESVKSDLAKMRSLFQNTMSVNKNIKFNIKEISGDQLVSTNVQNTVKSLTVGANDAIILYYSGHGSNPQGSNSEFPTAAMIKSSYKLENMGNLISNLKPRLAVVIGDLCNSVPRTRTALPEEPLFRSAPAQHDPARVAEFLIKAKGKIVSTSSSYDEYSYSLGNNGAFTNSFIDAMTSAINSHSNMPATWDAVLKQSYKEAYNKTKNIVNKPGTKGQNGFYRGSLVYN
ncbi:caspase family protein [Sphingobacterium tabacisoli]|uniref:Caspase family protein n=1 Tax=Sphingobacterium tabacisoli TaxID=2044855 RepID=A0ABW5L1S8_9SPHI|nr:caspase family protein [Sphingobacterium tabacisoli]